MQMTDFEGYTYVEGGVCAARGFQANGVYSGIDQWMSGRPLDLQANAVSEIKADSEISDGTSHKNDLGLVYSEAPCQTAAVYTQNKVKGAPLLVTKEYLAATGGISRAILVNSKNANTGNADGKEVARQCSKWAAKALGIQPEEVIVASTGVIGQRLPLEPFEKYIVPLAKGLSRDGHEKAATAIMTTDTVKKEVAVEFELDGKKCYLGGMAKGSGMIHPNMATTLNFVTSDVAISSDLVQKALDQTVKTTYNCLSIDGDTSTNDMVSVMANGLAGNALIESEEDAGYPVFCQALYIVMMNMTRMLAADGEGASKLLECTCEGAANLDTAITVAKSVISSSLLKCAMFGEDANCGRILCAIGYADADFDIDKVDVDLSSKAGTIEACRDGASLEFSEEHAAKVLAEDEIQIRIDLKQGEVSAKAWGCDLTYDYIKINADYRS